MTTSIPERSCFGSFVFSYLSCGRTIRRFLLPARVARSTPGLGDKPGENSPCQTSNGGEIAPGDIGREERQVNVIRWHRVVGGKVERFFAAPVFGFVEGKPLEVVNVVPEALADPEE